MGRTTAATILILLPLVSFGVQAPSASATLEGTVIDSISGRALAGVLVISRLPVVHVLADSEGRFSIAAASGRPRLSLGRTTTPSGGLPTR